MSDTTQGLAPDEKVCPYCAETIKAAAVKCRFCQSDLRVAPTPVDPIRETAPEVAPVEVAEPASEAQPDAEVVEAEPAAEWGREAWPVEPGRSGVLGVRLLAALLVLCLALGGVLWYLVDRAEHPDLGTAPNGQVTDNSFRNAAMSTASDTATQMLSYSWKTFDADRAKVRKLLTGKAATQYDEAMDQVKDRAATAKLTLTANVISVGTISVEEHSARLLLFVNTYTTSEGSKKQQIQQSRPVMDMTRKSGDWIVSNVDTI
jgi:hypothetical protein